MKSTEFERQVQERVTAFVEDISRLVQTAAFEAIGEALGAFGTSGTSRPRPVAERVRRSAPEVVVEGGVVTTVQRAEPRRAAKRNRRSPEDLEALGARVVEYLAGNPASRMEQIAAAVGESTKELQRPMQLLLAAKVVSSQGQKRATEYTLTPA